MLVHSRTIAPRSGCAAFSVSALMVAAQFSLAQHYADASGLLWAGQAVQAPVALAPVARNVAG